MDKYEGEAAIELETALSDLQDIYKRHTAERDKQLFAERFRRWKHRTNSLIQGIAGDVEARRFRELSDSLVTYDQHRDREVLPHKAFVQALIEDIAQHRSRAATFAVRAPTSALTRPPKHLFLSHAADDKALAEFVREQFRAASPQAEVFQASLPGQIPVGDDWLEVIKRQLRKADAYLVLLTPRSVTRPWVHFETGAAWMSDKPLFTVTAGDLNGYDIPMPLSSFQTLSLEDPIEAAVVFQQLHTALVDAEAFATVVRRLATAATRAEQSRAGWVGITLVDRFFAWNGPGLHSLPDQTPVSYPPELPNALQGNQMAVRLGRREKLTASLAKGWLQVFETDRKTFRREVLDGGGSILLTKPDSSQGHR